MVTLELAHPLPKCFFSLIRVSWTFFPLFPPNGNAGRVSGLKARGGFEVSMEWNEGQLIGATIHAMSNGSIHVRADGVRGIENDGESVDYATSEDRRVQFDTRVGTTYTLIF